MVDTSVYSKDRKYSENFTGHSEEVAVLTKQYSEDQVNQFLPVLPVPALVNSKCGTSKLSVKKKKSSLGPSREGPNTASEEPHSSLNYHNSSSSSNTSVTIDCFSFKKSKSKKGKKPAKAKANSTCSWSVDSLTRACLDSNKEKPYNSSATSLFNTSSTNLAAESSQSSIKLKLRPSTQAQSHAEVGIYRISRKRSKSSQSSVSGTKVELTKESVLKSDKKLDSSAVKQGIEEDTPYTPQLPGKSGIFDIRPPTKKPKIESKGKKKEKSQPKLKSSKEPQTSSSSSSPPGLISLRRNTRSKKTGSCASSRYVSSPIEVL